MTYDEALNIAETTKRNLDADKWQFRAGVCEAAAKAAVRAFENSPPVKSTYRADRVVDAIQHVFQTYRKPL